jgi:hypothetical protein
MADKEHTKQPVEEQRPAPDVVDEDPGEHLNRPEQPDFDPEERKPYEDPPEDLL